MKKLHYNTVSKTLIKCLKELMKEPLLENFILVGGTSSWRMQQLWQVTTQCKYL